MNTHPASTRPGTSSGRALGPAPTDSGARRPVGLGITVVGLAVFAAPGLELWVVLLGLSLALGVGVPLLASSSARVGEPAVVAVVLLAIVASAWFPYARASGDASARNRNHDGGVYVTRAAADRTLHGENPYTADFSGDLPATWARVQGADGDRVANPVGDRMPYLPAAFLVHVPFEAGADALGLGWDTRILSWAALAGVLVLLARRPGPPWARIGAVLVAANAFTVTYLAWGTNDAFALAAFLAAIVLARERPVLAGGLLAVAISTKFLFLVAVVPLAAVTWAVAGRPGLRRWWSLPAVLAVTGLPYLLWAPGPFLDDVLWFNLGRTEPLMPTSGLGLPAAAPDLLGGPVLAAITLAGGLFAFVGVPLLARRWRSFLLVGPLTSLALLGLLIPARTFQINYLALVVGAAATGWLAIGDRVGTSPPVAVEVPHSGADPAT